MDFMALAAECAPWVAPQTMAAIVKTESQFKPYAININGGASLARQPASKAEATVTARWLIDQGYNIDLGLGQINSVNLPKIKLSVEDAFDGCKNIAAAATILYSNYKSATLKVRDEQAALHLALSLYNTGSYHRGFSNGYVRKVVSNTPQSISVSATNATPMVPVTPTGIPLILKKGNRAVPKQAESAEKPIESDNGINVYGQNKPQAGILVF